MTFHNLICRKSWLYEGIVSELIHVFSYQEIKRYISRFSPILQREHRAAISFLRGGKIKKVICIGSGVIPFSCIYYSDFFKTTTGLDNNYIAVKLSKFVCHKYFSKSIHILHYDALKYTKWNNSLVIVSLLTQNKHQIIKNILDQLNNIVIVRNPKRDNSWRYEFVNIDYPCCITVEHPNNCFNSLILNNLELQRRTGDKLDYAYI